MERLKVMNQIAASGKNEYSTIIGGLRHMKATEGWAGFFKGNGSNVARIAPYSALQFLFFDIYKVGLQKSFLAVDPARASTAKIDKNGYPALNPYWTLAAGALAGSTSTFFCYPLDLVRSFLTVQTNQGKYKGIVDCLRQVYRAEGIQGWYRGCVPTLVGITPYIAINFFVFDSLKKKYLPASSDPYFTYINLLLGGVSGGTAALMTYPFDVIRRKVQLAGLGKNLVQGMPEFNGALDCIRVMYKTQGFQSFFRGLTPCLLKVIPSMAIAFTIHESLRNFLDFDFKK